MVTPLSSARLIDLANVSRANSQACSKLTPGNRLRNLGEPTTIAFPPSPHNNRPIRKSNRKSFHGWRIGMGHVQPLGLDEHNG